MEELQRAGQSEEAGGAYKDINQVVAATEAAGMSRRQVWRSVLVEAGILGTIGAVVGSIAGMGVGALLVAFAGGLGSGLQVPWATIALSLVLGVALAMLAAAQPARIAGRRSIVAAVRGE